MKTGYGCSSEQEKCAFCNKYTSEYMEYSQGSVDVRCWCHWECRKDLSKKVKPLLTLLKQATKGEKDESVRED